MRAAREAGATGVWTNPLLLRPGRSEHFLEHLAQHWPELLPEYEELYRRSAYLGAGEAEAGQAVGIGLREGFRCT